jgi:hypothetical protein
MVVQQKLFAIAGSLRSHFGLHSSAFARFEPMRLSQQSQSETTLRMF